MKQPWRLCGLLSVLLRTYDTIDMREELIRGRNLLFRDVKSQGVEFPTTAEIRVNDEIRVEEFLEEAKL